MSHGQSRNKSRAITLMELLIALVLFGMVILGISNIETFCRHVFMGTDRKAKVINDAGYVLEHMSKFIGGAVGNSIDFPVTLSEPLNGPSVTCTRAVQVRVDYAPAAEDMNGINDTGDRQIMYCFNDASHTVSFYSNYTAAVPGAPEVLSRSIVGFLPDSARTRNYIDVNITGCWNASVPSGDPKACGSVDNPRLTLQTRIAMPLVTINATP